MALKPIDVKGMTAEDQAKRTARAKSIEKEIDGQLGKAPGLTSGKIDVYIAGTEMNDDPILEAEVKAMYEPAWKVHRVSIIRTNPDAPPSVPPESAILYYFIPQA